MSFPPLLWKIKKTRIFFLKKPGTSLKKKKNQLGELYSSEPPHVQGVRRSNLGVWTSCGGSSPGDVRNWRHQLLWRWGEGAKAENRKTENLHTQQLDFQGASLAPKELEGTLFIKMASGKQQTYKQQHGRESRGVKTGIWREAVHGSEWDPPAPSGYRSRTPVARLISPKQETEGPFSGKTKSSSEKRPADLIICIYNRNVTGYPINLQRSLVGNKFTHIYMSTHRASN